MNKNIIAGLIIFGLILVSGFGGYQYSESEHAKKVTELNKTIYDLGVVVQNETNRQAETNRRLKVANRDRINALKINDHINATVKHLQDKLNESVKELDTVRTDYNYIILDVGSINRVYNQSRRECNGLADTNDSPVVSAQLSEFTGDSIAEVVRYTVARYCEIATDYNNLYLDAEKLLAN